MHLISLENLFECLVPVAQYDYLGLKQFLLGNVYPVIMSNDDMMETDFESVIFLRRKRYFDRKQ